MQKLQFVLAVVVSSLAAACNRNASNDTGEGTQTAPNTDMGSQQQTPRSEQGQQPGQMQPGQTQPGQAQPGQAQPGQAQPGDQAAGWRGGERTDSGASTGTTGGTSPNMRNPPEGRRGTGQTMDGGSRSP